MIPNVNPIQSQQDNQRDGLKAWIEPCPPSGAGRQRRCRPACWCTPSGRCCLPPHPTPSFSAPARPGIASFLPDDWAQLLHPSRLRPRGEGAPRPPCSLLPGGLPRQRGRGGTWQRDAGFGCGARRGAQVSRRSRASLEAGRRHFSTPPFPRGRDGGFSGVGALWWGQGGTAPISPPTPPQPAGDQA